MMGSRFTIGQFMLAGRKNAHGISKARTNSIPIKSTGIRRKDTALVFRAGFSIPRVTAAAESSSAVSVADTMRGITVERAAGLPMIQVQ